MVLNVILIVLTTILAGLTALLVNHLPPWLISALARIREAWGQVRDGWLMIICCRGPMWDRRMLARTISHYCDRLEQMGPDDWSEQEIVCDLLQEALDDWKGLTGAPFPGPDCHAEPVQAQLSRKAVPFATILGPAAITQSWLLPQPGMHTRRAPHVAGGGGRHEMARRFGCQSAGIQGPSTMRLDA